MRTRSQNRLCCADGTSVRRTSTSTGRSRNSVCCDTVTKVEYKPGDVLVVHDGGFWAWVIRLGPWLRNKLYGTNEPTKWNHVLIVMPPDAKGNAWAIGGLPGGVVWRDLEASGYLTSPLTLSNAEQNKTEEQRAAICEVMQAMADRKT